MDDFQRRRRRFFEGMDDPFGDDFFGQMEEEFRRMQENFNHFLSDFERNPDSEHFRKYVWGFSMHPGADGKPVFEEFGNVPRPGEEYLPGEREPLVEVHNGKGEVTVIAELPGVDKKDIEMDADEESLVISVNTHDRRYRKELDMPVEVDPDTIKAQYKNGILEVKIKHKKPKAQRKKRVKVE